MSDFNVGGQAVIEGVMIRSKSHIATAVRRLDKSIYVKTTPYEPLSKRVKLLSLPLLRGFVTFFEMLWIGISTLNFSAAVAAEDVDKDENSTEVGKKPHPLVMAATVVFAMTMAIGLFFFLPLWFTQLLGIEKSAVVFNLAAGGIRLTMFITYVWVLSLFGEFKRIFEYHGAEHKSIWAYEMKEELTPEIAKKYTTLHPRCGTSFILIVALLAILIFATADSTYQLISGHPPHILVRFLIHFSLLPLVSGGSYELLKFSGRTRNHPLTKILIRPGLWLQKITTKEPSLDQLEVAIVAVRASLGMPQTVDVQEAVDA